MEIPKTLIVNKERFETPLEALIRARFEHNIPAEIPMSYAGRLDPMAMGQMMVLIGDECKNREAYLNRDKTYKLEILFGIGTDTQDVFGVIEKDEKTGKKSIKELNEEESIACMIAAKTELPSFVGTHVFQYPKYSTKGLLAEHDEKPEREMTIKHIRFDGGKMVLGTYVKALAFEACEKIKGDFRYGEIKASWEEINDAIEFPVIKIEVECAAGTYMRTLAEELGKKLGIPALAFYIERIKT